MKTTGKILKEPISVARQATPPKSSKPTFGVDDPVKQTYGIYVQTHRWWFVSLHTKYVLLGHISLDISIGKLALDVIRIICSEIVYNFSTTAY